MTTAIHQLVHTLSYGDAISGEVLALQRCLQELGFESEIFSINTHPHYQGRTRDYRTFPEGFRGDVVFHFSLGSPLSDLYLRCTHARRSMIYHNLTPARWFEGVNPRIVHDIQAGVTELPTLCRATDCLIADSSFNASELQALGFSAQVLQLPVDPERWAGESNPGILQLLRGDPALHLLHVGRVAPNKCIEDIIKVFYFLHHHVRRNSRLWLVGIDIDTELYSFSLKRLARELEVEKCVHFSGGLADSEVRAFYEASSSYLCMSEHEGFCVPLIEAMNFGLPIVAYASSAVPDTLGAGGILVREKRHAEIAELIEELHVDSALRARVIAEGRRRVANLRYENFQQRVRELFAAPGSYSSGAGVSEAGRG